jgi:hypothetical protein
MKNTLFFTILLSLLFTVPAYADARTDYLINMLQNGSSYRVKVQAAESLGRLKSTEALPSLLDALKDKSKPVVIAAASALMKIGNPSVIPQLKEARKKNKNSAVKSQLTAAINELNSIQSNSANESLSTITSSAYSFLVKVDDMGNSSSSKRTDVTSVLKNIVIKSLQKRPGIDIQPAKMSPKKIKKIIKSGKKSFILSGSIIKLERENNYIVVNITLNVFSNPSYNLIMMPAGEIKVPIGTDSNIDIKKAEENAMTQLVDNLISKILEAAPNVL